MQKLTIWQRIRKFWLVGLAGLATAAEAMIQAGVEFPGVKHPAGWVRALVFLSVIGGGFILRWFANRQLQQPEDAGDTQAGMDKMYHGEDGDAQG